MRSSLISATKALVTQLDRVTACEAVSCKFKSYQVHQILMLNKNHIILDDGSEYWIHPEDGWCANHKGAMKICEYCEEMWMDCKCHSNDKEEPSF